jgi:hypothetical protein
MTDLAWPTMLPRVLMVRCESCHRMVELSCEGLGGTVLYHTYQEYECPHCHKQNHARTPGHILSVRAPTVER